MFCKDCEALGESCCEASKARRDLNTRLAGIVERQSTSIQGLLATVADLRETLRKLMDLHRIDK
jgi:hypothetical protein